MDSIPRKAPPTSSGSASTSRAGISPMPMDALDYFSETAARLGDGGSSGVMIQSPDGRPAGIFFHPRTNSSNSSAGLRTPASSGSGHSASRTHRLGFGSSSGDDNRLGTPLHQSTTRVLGDHAKLDVPSASRADSSSPSSIDPRSTSSPSPLLATDANGNLFQPQIELQSLLSRQRPPTATSLVPLDPGVGMSAEKFVLTGLTHDAKKSEMELTIDSDTAMSPDGTQGTENGSTAASATTVGQGATSTAQRRHSLIQNGDGSSARPSFPFALPSAAVRPSAQPQSGLLIGAGFSKPRRKGGALGARQTAASIEVLPPIKVLVVEDNPINLKILTTFFTHRKIKYGVARDGREAVNEWQTGGYHLILMDIQLPIMSGIEATKEIRRLEQQANIGPYPSATPSVTSASNTSKELGFAASQAVADASAASSIHPPNGAVSPGSLPQNSLRASVIIVALTASVLNSDRVAALAAGCNDFLTKPVKLRWLERKVIEWGSMQYLISFRDLPESYQRRNGGRGAAAAAAARRSYLPPTIRESQRSGGLVDRGFGSGPDQMARELAGRLYIGKKTRPAVAAAGGDGNVR